MADGPTRITGYLDSEDTRATLRAVESVGAEVREGDPDDHGGIFVEIEGAGLRGARSAEIDVGNAGTLLRIMPGWLAGQPEGEWTFDGDDSIRRRPVDRIAEPLRQMGADVDCRDGLLAAADGARRRAPRDRLRDAGRERAGQVVPAARRAAGRGRDDDPRDPARRATTPSGCWRRWAPRSAARGSADRRPGRPARGG